MARSKDKKIKVRKEFRLPEDLTKWAESFAARKYTTFTQVIIQSLVEFRERNET